MPIYLYLDDVRTPPKDGTPWTVVRTADQCIEALKKYDGNIELMSFDHDLAYEHYQGKQGTEKNGYDVAKWLREEVIASRLKGPSTFAVHSMNPVGAENIRRACNDIMNWRRANMWDDADSYGPSG